MSQTITTATGDLLLSDWWTARRTKAAGLAGVIGGLTLAGLSISRTGLGIDPGPISMVYLIGYVLLIITLLAGNARYSPNYGSRGRTVAAVLILALASYAGSIIILGTAGGLFGIPFSPVTTLIGIVFVTMRLFGTLYRLILWRRTNASRITAGLFAVILPAVVILGPLAIIGLPAVGTEAPLYLAFIALGYELFRVD